MKIEVLFTPKVTTKLIKEPKSVALFGPYCKNKT